MRHGLNQSSFLDWCLFFSAMITTPRCFPWHSEHEIDQCHRTHCESNTLRIFALYPVFLGMWEEQKNSASIITKESLFGTLPPQMAWCLMFLSRRVAFSQSWMGCVHSHCLMSKIEGKPCKLWMPPCQRHGIAKTMCVDITFALLRLYFP